jgi:hypothetical protein
MRRVTSFTQQFLWAFHGVDILPHWMRCKCLFLVQHEFKIEARFFILFSTRAFSKDGQPLWDEFTKRWHIVPICSLYKKILKKDKAGWDFALWHLALATWQIEIPGQCFWVPSLCFAFSCSSYSLSLGLYFYCSTCMALHISVWVSSKSGLK